MKEETNKTGTTWPPSDAQVKEMYNDAWLNFHADAQEAIKDLNRHYAKMVNTFGSYKQMPNGVKYIFKEHYAAHKAKWGENGEEQRKRFGVGEPDPTKENTEIERSNSEHPTLDLEREEFKRNLYETRNKSKNNSFDRQPS